jgi:beta-N-acetylhexosaminidase
MMDKILSQIDRYIASDHAADVLRVWNAAFAETWPLTAPLFANVTQAATPNQVVQHFIARTADRIVGFVATQRNPRRVATPQPSYSGNIMAVVVDPPFQRQGIGRALIRAAYDHLVSSGAQSVQIGGKFPRFFPGAPQNLPGARPFFEACGWQLDRHAIDLVRNLSDYQLSPAIQTRMTAEGITIEPATDSDAESLIAFQSREFAGWVDTYRYVARVGDFADFLIARDPKHSRDRGIIGALLMTSPGSQSHPSRPDVLWKTLLGADAGGMGEVGVAADQRGRGVGLALVAYGAEILRKRGAGNAFIGFTDLADFYGKLGFGVWRAYDYGFRRVEVTA